MTEDNVTSLKKLLYYNGRHGHYQRLPPTLPKNVLDEFKDTRNPRLDEERFNWISSNISINNKTIIEIGANIGYFSSRLGDISKNAVYAYEPDSKLSNTLNKIIKIGNLEETVTVFNDSITLETIDTLPEVDIILNLNVIQHAGYDFDSNLISSLEDWETYAIKYLNKLSNKANTMVFQMGYQLWGFNETICNENEIIRYTTKLLQKSGWDPISCGVLLSIPKDNETAKYVNYNLSNEDSHLITKTNLPFSYIVKMIKSKLLNEPYISYRFAQRPIFICKSRFTGNQSE